MLKASLKVGELYERYYNRPDLGEGDMLNERFQITDYAEADWVLWSAVFEDSETATMLAHLLRGLPYAQGFYMVDEDLLMLLVPKDVLGYLLHMTMAYDYVPDSLPAFITLKDTTGGL